VLSASFCGLVCCWFVNSFVDYAARWCFDFLVNVFWGGEIVETSFCGVLFFCSTFLFIVCFYGDLCEYFFIEWVLVVYKWCILGLDGVKFFAKKF
jgi:hypothetical protein